MTKPWPEGLGFEKPFFQKGYDEIRDSFNLDHFRESSFEKYYLRINNKPYGFECVRCKRILPLQSCSNCGGTEDCFESTEGSVMEFHFELYCTKCHLRARKRWICPYCNTSNSAFHTLGVYIDEAKKWWQFWK